MDRAHEYTDNKIESVEKKINKVYKDLQAEIDKKTAQYFDQFKDADDAMRAKVNAEEMTEAEYNTWRTTTMMRGAKWDKFLKDMCKIIHEANKKAISLSNTAMTDVYIENYNHVGKDIERQVRELQ